MQVIHDGFEQSRTHLASMTWSDMDDQLILQTCTLGQNKRIRGHDDNRDDEREQKWKNARDHLTRIRRMFAFKGDIFSSINALRAA